MVPRTSSTFIKFVISGPTRCGAWIICLGDCHDVLSLSRPRFQFESQPPRARLGHGCYQVTYCCFTAERQHAASMYCYVSQVSSFGLSISHQHLPDHQTNDMCVKRMEVIFTTGHCQPLFLIVVLDYGFCSESSRLGVYWNHRESELQSHVLTRTPEVEKQNDL